MGESIDLELRFAAEDLYIVDGITLEQTARRTGIALPTLKRWSAEEGWKEKQAEYRKTLSDIRRKKIELRKGFLERALTSGDPQQAYVFARLEDIAARQERNETPPAMGVSREINTPADAVAALSDALEMRLNAMLTQPEGFNLKAVQEVEKTMALIEKLRAKYAAAEEKGAEVKFGLDDEDADYWRKEILGIK